MKIVVLIKEVPDTYNKRVLDLETGLADRAASDAILDESSERALEVALSHAEVNDDVEILALCLGPESAATSARKAFAMGAHRVAHIADDALLGADIGLTAEALAAAIRQDGFDLVIAGSTATDGTSGMVPAALAELLDAALLSGLSAVDISGEAVAGTRITDGQVQQLRAAFPAVISITEALPEARFPNFKGIMAAKKKKIEQLDLTELSVEADREDTARSIMLSIAEKPPKQAGVLIVDSGDAGEQLAAFLVDNHLA
ncbi:electron transfer flavoprotein subunit beta [Microlunatus phosphovorus NM-1]|uniref:Electron transfer flavoprotein subunit beta n=1 Tax=Microlunatus phosphovorus (strain ATCC 700054 / DSM 10555 / JCM 9379 / NBRC 101784 / NCIMB 13414 / VKM Ac-1990 / NM-1) TaxID=1032480 RepID=F5XFN9_MICPN|nr:electron transfer flavoprotein subunit beta/FixA family protein [Microlunatus phosphovorus]BAK35446.1 electron transfer flavoprotein subunit beta [Microlunatus phosphovorus NM-1]